jgi:hypothetical protein
VIGPADELKIGLVSRLRADAALRSAKPPRRSKKKRGRKPKFGAPLGKLAGMARCSSAFKARRVMIYGKTVTLLLREFEAYWPAIGRVVKVVITRDPKRPKRVAYLMTTDCLLDAIAVVELFAQRWTIEQLFSVAKLQMGLDSTEARKERAVVRHAALCMALIAWTEVWAYKVHPGAWARPFAQKLAAFRATTLTSTIFEAGPRTRGSRRIAHDIGSLFTSATGAA